MQGWDGDAAGWGSLCRGGRDGGGKAGGELRWRNILLSWEQGLSSPVVVLVSFGVSPAGFRNLEEEAKQS